MFTRLAAANVRNYNNHPVARIVIIYVYSVVVWTLSLRLLARMAK